MPKPLLIATYNPAKLGRYQAILNSFPELEACSPEALGIHIAVEESGASAAENARLKAQAFADASGLPALGIDEALYISALPADQQPGVMVRRNGGKPLDDAALLAAFLEIARRLEPKQRAIRWLYALCLVVPGGEIYSAETGWSGWLTDTPALPYQPGYPLSSILLDGETRKPIRRLSAAEARRREEPLYQAVGQMVRAWLKMGEEPR